MPEAIKVGNMARAAFPWVMANTDPSVAGSLQESLQKGEGSVPVAQAPVP